ncbi:MAG: plastocyanin/azurin family copper-binding protein [Bacteroidota bacterium]
MRLLFITSLFFGLLLTTSLSGQDAPPPTEEDYYQIITLPLPEGVVLEVGGLATLPNGSIAASTRRGEVYIIDNPYMTEGRRPHYRLFARGLHTILGLAWHDGTLYCAQRGELTRLHDENDDGRADRYETVAHWPLTSHYHEYSFGPKVGPDSSMYVTGNIAFRNPNWWRGVSGAPGRGWTMRIDPQTGELEPFAAGMRSPCGIGMIDGEFFYADNQGDWMGSGGLVHVERGDFTGHPASLAWSGEPDSPVKLTTEDVYYRVNPQIPVEGQPLSQPSNQEDEIPYSFYEFAQDVPGVKTPAVWLPHSVLGISTSEIIVDETEGVFGPFAGQVLIGDQGQSKIMRVNLEKIDGVYQGAAFNFIEGFQSGVLRMSWGRDGSLFVGQTNRGWGSTGSDPYGLQRVVWNGETPFEMHSITAEVDGFTINFTEPVDKTTAADTSNYDITSFIYKYHPAYGSPIVDREMHEIMAIEVAEDGLSARLAIDGIRQYHIHEIKPAGVQSYNGGHGLLHNAGYYTLNRIPSGDSMEIPEPVVEEVAPPVMDHSHHQMPAADPVSAQAAETEVAIADTPRPAPVRRRSRGSAKRQTTMPGDWGGTVDETIVLSTLPGMRYDRGRISVRAGARVKLTFYNNDDMPHNLVITKPGTMPSVGAAAASLGLDGPAKEYVPSTGNVLFHSKLMGPGTTETIYFKAPDAPGDYNYVCTFPGHWRTMNGVLRVTP